MKLEDIEKIFENVSADQRVDLTIGIEAKMCNPNGNPDDENRPRQLPDGRGHITSGCIKNKTRLAASKIFDEPIFTYRHQTKKEGIEKYHEEVKNSDKTIMEALLEAFFDLRCYGSALTYDKKNGTGDIEVRSLKGPIRMSEFVSHDPIDPLHCSITSQQVSNESQEGNGTFGEKFMVQHALYEGKMSYNPYGRFNDEAFSTEDMIKLIHCLNNFGPIDQAANRLIETAYIVIAIHPDGLGKRVSEVTGRSVLEVTRNPEDGEYSWNLKEDLPSEVNFHVI